MRSKERLTIPHVKQLARKILLRLLAIAVVLTIVEVALGLGLQVWSCNLDPNRTSTASTVFCRDKFSQWWFTRLVTLNPPNYFQEYCTNSRNETYIGETARARRYDRDWMIDHRMRAAICWVDRNLDGTVQAYETDRWGFVYSGPENDLKTLDKDKDTIRIIVLGGSTVEGLGADSVKSIPAYLYHALKVKYPSQKFQVINAGVGGFDSKYQIVYFAGELIYLNPDIVIFYDGFNDYYGLTPAVSRSPFLNRATVDRNRIDTILGSARNIIFLVRVAIFGNISHYSRYSPTVYLIGSIGKVLTREDPAVESYTSDNLITSASIFEKNVRSFLGVCLANHMRCAHFLQPYPFVHKRLMPEEKEGISKGYYPHVEDTLRFFYAESNSRLSKLRDEFNDPNFFLLADITDSFEGIEAAVYIDIVHLNQQGNYLVAKRIAVEIAPLMNALVSSRK